MKENISREGYLRQQRKKSKESEVLSEDVRMGEPTANVLEEAINKELETLEEGTVMVCNHFQHQDHHQFENLILHGIIF